MNINRYSNIFCLHILCTHSMYTFCVHVLCTCLLWLMGVALYAMFPSVWALPHSTPFGAAPLRSHGSGSYIFGMYPSEVKAVPGDNRTCNSVDTGRWSWNFDNFYYRRKLKINNNFDQCTPLVLFHIITLSFTQTLSVSMLWHFQKEKWVFMNTENVMSISLIKVQPEKEQREP